ncbi:hypothetical protein ACNSOP_00530 [Aliarcobacter lanthieri]|uniref:hypothetical protein n=1 Tax=Arcobacteraceae TaxID=2808963 RepID=UPI000DEA241E|nr:hypothetical protein [Arcobacter sp. CECT 9188]RBQ27034.1 hypothetical protein CRU88_04655 [Arcobacter sp. CECT 9188]
MREYINSLKIPENSGKKIGLFRTICSIVGGLVVAYLGMTLLIFIIPGSAGESIIVPLLLNTFAWASAALWISLSKTKYVALQRCVIPTLIFGIALIILYNI